MYTLCVHIEGATSNIDIKQIFQYRSYSTIIMSGTVYVLLSCRHTFMNVFFWNTSGATE